ncbi:G2/mitotic-specific cyclin-A-like isoform X2 [Artemia franciscana]
MVGNVLGIRTYTNMASIQQNKSNQNRENGNTRPVMKKNGLQQRSALSSVTSNRTQPIRKVKSSDSVKDENVSTKQQFKFYKSKNDESKEVRESTSLRETTSRQTFTIFSDEQKERTKPKQTFSVYCDDRENDVVQTEVRLPELPRVPADNEIKAKGIETAKEESGYDKISEKGSASPTESDKENRYKQPLAYSEELIVARETVFGPRHSLTEGAAGSATSELPSIEEEEGESVAVPLIDQPRISYEESQFCEEYTDDIYKYLREIEERIRPRHNYMKKQPDLTPSMRSILVDWLVEVSDEYKLHDETLHLAVSYIDRFLSQMSVLRGKLQLVGTAAMFIAAKYEEIYPPEVSEFVYITDDTYTKRQVLRMEHLILKVLAFDLGAPTSLYFLHRFCRIESTTDEIKHLAMYMCQLTLLESDPYLRFLPSQIAAAAFAIARHTCGLEPWNEKLIHKTGYRLRQLRDICYFLHKTLVGAPVHAQQAIVEKFKTSKMSCVSQLRPRPLFNFPN